VLGWTVVCDTRVRFMRGASETSGAFLYVATRVLLAGRSRAQPGALVYFERRIANGHGFARVYRDLNTIITDYGYYNYYNYGSL
jgi:hypothetical protein